MCEDKNMCAHLWNWGKKYQTYVFSFFIPLLPLSLSTADDWEEFVREIFQLI